MVKSSACPTAALYAPSTRTAEPTVADEVRLDACDVVSERPEGLLDQRHERLVSHEVAQHALGPPVEAVELLERLPEPGVRVVRAIQPAGSGSGFLAAQCAEQAANTVASSGKCR